MSVQKQQQTTKLPPEERAAKEPAKEPAKVPAKEPAEEPAKEKPATEKQTEKQAPAPMETEEERIERKRIQFREYNRRETKRQLEIWQEEGRLMHAARQKKEQEEKARQEASRGSRNEEQEEGDDDEEEFSSDYVAAWWKRAKREGNGSHKERFRDARHVFETAKQADEFFKQIPKDLDEVEASTIEDWEEWLKKLPKEAYDQFAKQLPGKSFVPLGQRLRQATIEFMKQQMYPEGRPFSPRKEPEPEHPDEMFDDDDDDMVDDVDYEIAEEPEPVPEPPVRESRPKKTPASKKKQVAKKSTAKQPAKKGTSRATRSSTQSTPSTVQAVQKTASSSKRAAAKGGDILIHMSLDDYNNRFVGRYVSYNFHILHRTVRSGFVHIMDKST